MDELVLNLSSATTFVSSSNLASDVKQAIDFLQLYFDREEGCTREQTEKEIAGRKKRSSQAVEWNSKDRNALLGARTVLEDAFRDPEWRLIANSVTALMHVQGMDDGLINVFGGLRAELNSFTSKRTVAPLGSLVRLRKVTQELRLQQTPTWSSIVEDGVDELLEEVITLEQKYLSGVSDLSEAGPKPKKKKGQPVYLPFPTHSSLPQIQLGRTSSSKLNYIVDRG